MNKAPLGGLPPGRAFVKSIRRVCVIIKKVLTIAGSDSGGGAGIQADLKTITVLGGFGMSVVTAITAQNTLGVQGVYELPAEFITLQFDSVAADIGVDAAKTGMLSSSAIIEAVARKVEEYSIYNLVVDPVMVAKGGSRLLRQDAMDALVKKLIPLAFIITPNIDEAEALSGLSISGIEDMRRAAEIIHRMGARHVVVKGGHLEGEAADLYFDGSDSHVFSSPRIATQDTHGTGCTFSAAIATELAGGMTAFEAVRKAKDYITEAIKYSLRLGAGHGSTNHFAPARRGMEQYTCLMELKDALRMLRDGRCADSITHGESNIGYALSYASAIGDVAAFPGGLDHMECGKPVTSDPGFGAFPGIAEVILAAMRCDNEYRSAMSIRCDEGIIGAGRELGYSVTRIGSPAAGGIGRLMDAALAGLDGVPDLVYAGDGGSDVAYMLGKDPINVAVKVLKSCQRLG